MRKLFSLSIALLCCTCLIGCDLDDVANQMGYVPVANCCEYCECPLDVGDLVGDLVDDILDGKWARIEDPDWDE